MNEGKGGIGFGGVLTIVFIVLKLCGVIEWSWLWVLSPIWISLAISFIIMAIITIYCKIKYPDDPINWRMRF